MMLAYAMWVLSVLLLIVGQLAGDLHQAIVEERQATERVMLRSAAISGLEVYRSTLVANARVDFSHHRSALVHDHAACSFQAVEGIRTVCYHLNRGRSRTQTALTLGACDEESRLNILTADIESIARLPGVTITMAENLNAYMSSEPVMPPRALEDLRVVSGWESVDFSELSWLITFYGSGKINLNTASTDVLRLQGLSDRSVVLLESFRSGPNGVKGDSDDRFFKGLSEIVPRLDEYGAADDILLEYNNAIQLGSLTPKSEYYRVRARSINETTGRQFEVRAIVNVEDNGTIVAWEEYQPS